jgi:hypothetical protein
MAFLKFRGNTTSPTKPLSTTAANTPLSNVDIDGNFASLNDSKLEISGGTITGNLTVTGTTNSESFNSTSDARFKKDLVKIEEALDKIKSLTGYTFTLTESDTRSSGLIAQDVERILPEVIGGNDEKKTLNYGAMLGLVVEAIKELDDKLEDIRNSISNK